MTSEKQGQAPAASRPASEDGAFSRYALKRQADLLATRKTDVLRSERLSRARGYLMLALAALVIGATFRGGHPAIWGLIGAVAVAFTVLVVRHALLASAMALEEDRLDWIERALIRMGALEKLTVARKPRPSDGGARFKDASHANADDLDLFGEHSLFQALSRAETGVGEETFAGWLRTPSSAEVIGARQESAVALGRHPELLEDLAVFARRAKSLGKAEEPLAVWGESPAVLPTHVASAGASKTEGKREDPALRRRGQLVSAARVLVPLTLVLLFLSEALGLAGALRFAYAATLLAQAAIFVALQGPVGQLITLVSSRETPFGRFRPVLEHLEKERTFGDPALESLVQELRGGGLAASAEIGKLERILGFADLRHNVIIHTLANFFLLYDVWVAIALERWRAAHGRQIRRWLRVVGTFEALSSIACYALENPKNCWPTIEKDGAVFEASALGHPLLAAERRRTNPANLGGDVQALLVTGSNMSGKSTYLRSMGLMAVMAHAGLPVVASSARLSVFETWTSMRISDSLDRGMSHFYAELVRLRDVVVASHARPILFLLDEILHGTNSKERTIGARGVVLDLLRHGAIGAVSTHDFALVTLAEDQPNVRAVHFSDRVAGDEMVFDYQLREGVVQTTNAIRLMRSVGIDVDFEGADLDAPGAVAP